MTDMAIPTANGPVQAYVSEPSGPGPWPGVVVIHDVLGSRTRSTRSLS